MRVIQRFAQRQRFCHGRSARNSFSEMPLADSPKGEAGNRRRVDFFDQRWCPTFAPDLNAPPSVLERTLKISHRKESEGQSTTRAYHKRRVILLPRHRVNPLRNLHRRSPLVSHE